MSVFVDYLEGGKSQVLKIMFIDKHGLLVTLREIVPHTEDLTAKSAAMIKEFLGNG